MMQLTARMVRGYKGAAASILLLLIIEQRAVSQGEMRRNTGYGDEAINDAVWMLREDGLLVECGRYTWALLTDMRQLPIGAVPSGNPVDNSVDNFVDNSPVEDLGPDQSELALNESMNESMTQINDEDDSFIDEGSSGISGPAADADRPTAKALSDLGFYGRGITDMLAIPGLTMRQVRYHAEHAPNLGAALARIKKRQSVPENWGRDGPNERRKYTGGMYADIVVH
jgi:biotin operon repressor